MFDWDDDEFKGFPRWAHEHRPPSWSPGGGGAMDIVIGIACLVGIVVLLALICRCCCGSRHHGRVLQPAPERPGAAAYPQQQYSTVTVTAVPVIHPSAGGPYPGAGAPYPTAGAPYPTAGALYPTGGTPYPTAGAPYPVVTPYPAGPYPSSMPQPSAGPTAPEVHAFIGIAPAAPPGWHAQALPPSYEQVMSGEGKHPAFNPHAPH